MVAYHCEQVEAELAGTTGTGLPGLYVTARRPPIIAPTGDGLDLIVGVETPPGELDERAPAIQSGGKAYRIWREVANFTNLGPDPYVYIADRTTGTITFAPAAFMEKPDGQLEDVPRALAASPDLGREIRLWYRRGGGPEGNVPAGTLTVLKDQIAGAEVTNPEPATGGHAAETLDNALIRGPQELHSLQRAVTAQDYELVALSSSRAVVRAMALTRSAFWTFATPGTVEVLLVPALPEGMSGTAQVTAETLREHETEEFRAQIQAALEERGPLGINCLVNWSPYKSVRVTARVVVRREEDLAAVKQRVADRLYQTICPVPTEANSTGWPFGQALRASHVFDVALDEPAVRWVDHVRLLVSDVPEENVTSLTADHYQPQTWYAGGGATLYRSLNDADGWEAINTFPNEQIDLVKTHPEIAGLVGVVTFLDDNSASRVHVTWDCGDSWEAVADLQDLRIEDIAWTVRERIPILLMATAKGLFELAIRADSSGPVQVLVDSAEQDLGFYAVAASKEIRGVISVTVAAQNTRGVYLSTDGGQRFRHVGLQGEDIHELAVQYVGNRSFMWAGAFSPGGDDPGKGCFRWELRGVDDPPDRWRTFSQGWTGGSCRSIAFLGARVLAASHRTGVLWLANPDTPNSAWEEPDVNCGLPLRDQGRFLPVDTVDALEGDDTHKPVLLAGGARGVYRSSNEGVNYENASSKEFTERVTLPPTWLFVSGAHDITVVSEDETNRD